MDAVTLLKRQVELAHLMLEGTMLDVTSEQAHWQPGGGAARIGANYAHVYWVEDRYIGALSGDRPLAETSFSGRMGLSEAIPPGTGWDGQGASRSTFRSSRCTLGPSTRRQSPMCARSRRTI